MNTMPSPRGMPSTTAPTITQPKPTSAYGSQARATQLGSAFMTQGYETKGLCPRRFESEEKPAWPTKSLDEHGLLTSIATAAAPLAASWQSAFCASGFWPKPPSHRCPINGPRPVSALLSGELGHAPVENRSIFRQSR